jgi:hypothetical protein
MSSSDINIDELTKEVNSDINIDSDSNSDSGSIMNHIKKCIHTPMIYITTVPAVSCILVYFVKPNYIFDTDRLTKKKTINTTKFFKLVALISIIMNIFIYFYLIKQCNMKI